MEIVYSVSGALLLLLAGFLIGSMYRAGIIYKKTIGQLDIIKSVRENKIYALKLELEDLEKQLRQKQAVLTRPYIPFYQIDSNKHPLRIYHGDFKKFRTTPIQIPITYLNYENSAEAIHNSKILCSRKFVHTLLSENLIDFIFIEKERNCVEMHAEIFVYPFKNDNSEFSKSIPKIQL